MRNHIGKLVAAVLIAVGAFIGISYLCSNSGGGVALGEVIKEMQQVRAVTWTENSEVSPPDDPRAISRTRSGIRQCAYKAPGHERNEGTSIVVNRRTRELSEYKHVDIIDHNAGRGLMLDPETMTGRPYSFEPRTYPNPLYDLCLSPPQSTPPDAQSLGTRQVDGREAIGFRLLRKASGTYRWGGDITDIWVDGNTRRLVMLESRAADGSWTVRLTNFVFHEDLDDSLFSLEPPAGYTLTAPPGQSVTLSTGKEGK